MPGKLIGYITELTGSAEIRTPGGGIKLIALGDTVSEGDLLITSQATTVQIDFISGKSLKVSEKTEILLDETLYQAEPFPDDAVMAEVLALQQALLEGIEALAELESPEAGPEQQVGSSASPPQVSLFSRDSREGSVDVMEQSLLARDGEPVDSARDDLDLTTLEEIAAGAAEENGGSGSPGTPTITISDTFTGAVTEGDIGDPAVNANGTLNITSSDPALNPTFPDADIITEFTIGPGGDVLDLGDLFQGEQSNPMTDYLSIEFGGFDGDLDSESRIDVDGGSFFQSTDSITLENVDLAQGNSLTDQEILNNLISNGNLDIDT